MANQPPGNTTTWWIEKAEHIGKDTTGDNIEAKRVVPYEYNYATQAYQRGGLAPTYRYDYSASPIYYVGQASVGTVSSGAGWSIVKYDLTDSSNASGKVAIDVSWDNRATGTYL